MLSWMNAQPVKPTAGYQIQRKVDLNVGITACTSSLSSARRVGLIIGAEFKSADLEIYNWSLDHL